MKVTRRRLLGTAAMAAGAVTAIPNALAELRHPRSTASGCGTAPEVSAAGAVAGGAVPVRIRIVAGEPVRWMKGGIGASFHAIAAELPRNTTTGKSWAGSGWGGNPEPDDVKRWDELFKHAEWLGMNWCRVELGQRIYEPERRVFDWDNAEMQALYRILDWAQRRNIDVFLQQMWANVAWNAYPGNADDPVKRLRSAPRSLEEWAFGLGELVQRLIQDKGYTCIRWVCTCNEPGWDSFSWWQDSEMKAVSITPGMKAVREEFDRRGLTVPISGPDWTDLPEFDQAKVDFDAYVGAYDLHSYNAVFDAMESSGYTLAEAEERLNAWSKWARKRNKPLFLSEFGTMAYGWGGDDLAPACYMSGLKNASLVVRGINAGVDGFNRWSFTNRGDLDGQWQLVRTWDIDRNKLLDVFAPQPNAYYQFAMLSRFVPKHSGVLATSVEASYRKEDRKLVAAALRTPKSNTTIIVVNESYRAADVSIELQDLPQPINLQRYSLTRADEDKTHVDLRPDRSVSVTDELIDHIPPMSIVVYSTYNLGPDDTGIAAETHLEFRTPRNSRAIA